MNYQLLKEVRKSQKMTILKLSELTGIGRNTISFIENGNCNPRLNTLKLICKELDIDIKLVINEYSK